MRASPPDPPASWRPPRRWAIEASRDAAPAATCRLVVDEGLREIPTLVVDGELCVDSLPALETPLMGLVDAGADVVVADLGAVAFMDVRALRVIVDADARLRARGGRLLLVSPQRIVRRLIAASGLRDRLELTPDRQSAAVVATSTRRRSRR